jgi:hypothetical protein
MAIILVSQLLAQIVGLSSEDPTDVERDSYTAPRANLNVQVSAPQRGFITLADFKLPEVNSFPAPATPTLTNPTAGALAATTYFVRTTYVLEDGGESLLSGEATQVALINTLVSVTSPAAEVGAVGYNSYIGNTATGGSGSETRQNGIEPTPIGTAFQLPNTGLIVGPALPPQETGLVNGAATIVVSQGAGTLTVTTQQ